MRGYGIELIGVEKHKLQERTKITRLSKCTRQHSIQTKILLHNGLGAIGKPIPRPQPKPTKSNPTLAYLAN